MEGQEEPLNTSNDKYPLVPKFIAALAVALCWNPTVTLLASLKRGPKMIVRAARSVVSMAALLITAFPVISKFAAGPVVPMPTFPLFKIRIASVAPLLPTWKMMSAPAAPTPLVERKDRVEVVPVPPITKGTVAEVVIAGVTKVGLVAKTKAPVPVSSVTAEIKLADDGVARKVATPAPNPDTPVEIGSPVTLVITPEAGVPKAGATKVLLLKV